MIGTEPLREIIKLCLASAYIKNERSVSLLIIAKPESGKTETLREFAMNNGVALVSDITYSGLVSLLDRAKEGTLKTLLLPDLLKVYGRKVSVSKNFFTLLNEVIEEGVKEVSIYDLNKDYGTFVRFNVIGCVTEREFFSHINQWGQIGFISRVIPFSYSYSAEQVKKIFDEIMKGEQSIEFQFLFERKKQLKEKRITISKNLAEKIRSNITVELAKKFSMKTGEVIPGFRFQKNLQTLAKASAYLDSRDKVSIKDVNKLIKLSNWMNYDLNPLT
jgi:hypothetical protein